MIGTQPRVDLVERHKQGTRGHLSSVFTAHGAVQNSLHKCAAVSRVSHPHPSERRRQLASFLWA